MTGLLLFSQKSCSKMLKLLLAAAVACPRAVAINSKGAPSYEAKMNLFAKNNRGESCASDEGLSDLDQQLLYAANTGNDKIVEVCLADGANPNAVVNGVSALMYAAQQGHLAVVDRLLDLAQRRAALGTRPGLEGHRRAAALPSFQAAEDAFRGRVLARAVVEAVRIFRVPLDRLDEIHVTRRGEGGERRDGLCGNHMSRRDVAVKIVSSPRSDFVTRRSEPTPGPAGSPAAHSIHPSKFSPPRHPHHAARPAPGWPRTSPRTACCPGRRRGGPTTGRGVAEARERIDNNP